MIHAALSTQLKKGFAMNTNNNQTNKDVKALMVKYGITCETKIIYAYKQYRYDNLQDVLRYAEIDTKRDFKNGSDTTLEK